MSMGYYNTTTQTADGIGTNCTVALCLFRTTIDNINGIDGSTRLSSVLGPRLKTYLFLLYR